MWILWIMLPLSLNIQISCLAGLTPNFCFYSKAVKDGSNTLIRYVIVLYTGFNQLIISYIRTILLCIDRRMILFHVWCKDMVGTQTAESDWHSRLYFSKSLQKPKCIKEDLCALPSLQDNIFCWETSYYTLINSWCPQLYIKVGLPPPTLKLYIATLYNTRRDLLLRKLRFVKFGISSVRTPNTGF